MVVCLEAESWRRFVLVAKAQLRLASGSVNQATNFNRVLEWHWIYLTTAHALRIEDRSGTFKQWRNKR